MLRAMAKQAEAEREKRSKIIHAEGEFNAAQKAGGRLLRLMATAANDTATCAICRRLPRSVLRRTPPSSSRLPIGNDYIARNKLAHDTKPAKGSTPEYREAARLKQKSGKGGI